MYQFHGNLKAIKGNADKLANILLEASKEVSLLKGCKLYVISKDITENDKIWITEIWDSKEEHDNSLKLDSVKSLIGQAMPLLDGIPSGGQELSILGGYGII